MSNATPYFHTGTHFLDGENCEKCGGNPLECDPTSSCKNDNSLELEVRKHLIDVPYAYKTKDNGTEDNK